CRPRASRRIPICPPGVDAENDARYDRLPDSQGGRVLNTDIAREMYPKFRGDNRAELSLATHRPAGRYVRDRFSRMLARTDLPGEKFVRFLAGGGGSGKTTAAATLSGNPQLVYDTTLSAP